MHQYGVDKPKPFSNPELSTALQGHLEEALTAHASK